MTNILFYLSTLLSSSCIVLYSHYVWFITVWILVLFYSFLYFNKRKKRNNRKTKHLLVFFFKKTCMKINKTHEWFERNNLFWVIAYMCLFRNICEIFCLLGVTYILAHEPSFLFLLIWRHWLKQWDWTLSKRGSFFLFFFFSLTEVAILNEWSFLKIINQK